MSGEKAGENTGGLVRQDHGGAIWQGAPENAAPGPGRPPSKVKEALRRDFDTRRRLLASIADGDVTIRLREQCPECGHEPEPLDAEEVREVLDGAPSVADRLKALDVMAKYSDLNQGADGPDRALVRELAEVVMAEVDDEDALRRIEDGWIEVISRRFG